MYTKCIYTIYIYAGIISVRSHEYYDADLWEGKWLRITRDRLVFNKSLPSLPSQQRLFIRHQRVGLGNRQRCRTTIKALYIIALRRSGMRNFTRAYLGTPRNSSNSEARDEAITRYPDVKLPLTTPLAWRRSNNMRFNNQTWAALMSKNRNWCATHISRRFL